MVFYSFKDHGIGEQAVYAGQSREQIEELVRRESGGCAVNFALLEERSGRTPVMLSDGSKRLLTTLERAYEGIVDAVCVGVYDRGEGCVMPITWKSIDQTKPTREELAAKWEQMQREERNRFRLAAEDGARALFNVLRRYPESEWSLIQEFFDLEQTLYFRARSQLVGSDPLAFSPQPSTDELGLLLAAGESAATS